MSASGRSRENGSDASGPVITPSAVTASSVVSANTETQSSVRHAGTMPAFEIMPRLGFSPTMLLSMAGTRPEPAVSVPSASGTSPAETATADPELDPPGMRSLQHRIDGNAIGRADADEAGGELVEIGLADDDGAGGAEPRHRGRIARGHVGEGRAGGGGRQSRNVDIVLHRDGNAIQRQPGRVPSCSALRPRSAHPVSSRRLMKTAGSLWSRMR